MSDNDGGGGSGGGKESLKIFVYSMDSCGHINACIGVAQTLAKRGHQIYLLLNNEFREEYEKYQFELILLKVDDNDDDEKKDQNENESTESNNNDNDDGKPKENPFKKVALLMQQTGLLSRATPLEKLLISQKNNFVNKFNKKLYQFNPQIAEAIESEQPDLFILDQRVIPPAVKQAKIPYVSIFSSAPLWMLESPDLPPPFSGYPTYGDRSNWAPFMEVFEKSLIQNTVQFQTKLDAHFGYVPTKTEVEFFATHRSYISPYLNIYAYPEELDYHDVIPIPDNFARIDAFVREVPERFELPSTFDYDPSKDKLIYLSMGSMGSIDVPLMKRIVSIVQRTPHKYIVSKGALADEYDLPPNCWGEQYLPQTRILPLVDLVITHGGNNTVTESFYFGKPMVVMPMFVDQYENAQRLSEKGYGIRIDPFSFEDHQLIDAIDQLLNNGELAKRLAVAVKRIRQSQCKEKVCDRIEKIVATVKKQI